MKANGTSNKKAAPNSKGKVVKKLAAVSKAENGRLCVGSIAYQVKYNRKWR
ncbi:MAG: hypothetical protein ACLRR3_11965 [Eubacterium sp.]